MTTRRRATHGIYNTLLTFYCSRGKIRAPLDVDQTIDFTIDYQHFCVLGRPGGPRDVVQCVEFTIY